MATNLGAANPIYRSGAFSASTRKAVAKVLAKTGRAKVDFYGPSTLRGLGSGTDGTGNTDLVSHAIPQRFAEILNSRGMPAECNSAIGAGNTANAATADNRLVYGSGWASGSY